jgi:pyrimidine operon attenuation protein/uracil phosphoribosyltransferase
MRPKTLIDAKQLRLIIDRLCYQLLEEHDDFSNTALIGIQPRGVELASRIASRLAEITKKKSILYGNLDITFYRDDFRRREEPLRASETQIEFSLEDKRVVLIDDVLYTGRTIRAAMDALLAFGRPRSVELLILIDRRFSRQLPVEPNYTGKQVDSLASQLVKVQWGSKAGEEKVLLYTTDEGNE